MVEQDANNSAAAGETGGAGTGPAGPRNPMPKAPDATKISTGKGEDNATKDSGAPKLEGGEFGFWTIFWPALILAVFVWMWRTGKLLAIKTYIGETKEQLNKCTWPTWDELKQHIVVVLISSFLLAIFTVVADNIVKEIVWGALLGSDTLLFDPPESP